MTLVTQVTHLSRLPRSEKHIVCITMYLSIFKDVGVVCHLCHSRYLGDEK